MEDGNNLNPQDIFDLKKLVKEILKSKKIKINFIYFFLLLFFIKKIIT